MAIIFCILYEWVIIANNIMIKYKNVQLYINKWLLNHMNTISDSTNCFDFYTVSDFFSEIFHMGIYSSIIYIVIISNDIFHERFSFNNIFCIFCKIFKNWKFSFCEFYWISWYFCGEVFHINRYISESE